jgi:colanic acid/amylovoran biosynthesis protein
MKVNRFLITGGHLYGNLGASAMSIVTVERLRSRFPDAEILFVSKYPDGERRNVSRYFDSGQAVRLLPASQVRATFLDVPLLLLATLFRAQPVVCCLSGLLKGFCESDIIVDIGGITFSEERGLSGLFINATWILLSVLAGKPVVKLSQAFGPIRQTWFRLVARFLLSRVSVLVARGRSSLEELRKLGLGHKSWECADLAFLLPCETTEATRWIANPENEIVVGVAPSSVLYKKYGGRPYITLMVAVIEQLLEDHTDTSIWLMAHAFRVESTLSNNDAPVCMEIYSSLSVSARSRTRLIVGDYTPAEMRAIIGKTDAFLACRFHAMVSALATGVPVAVLGWSHKYSEVQAQFGLDYCLDHRSATAGSICRLMNELVLQRVPLRRDIVTALPDAARSSATNFDILTAYVCGRKPQHGDGS